MARGDELKHCIDELFYSLQDLRRRRSTAIRACRPGHKGMKLSTLSTKPTVDETGKPVRSESSCESVSKPPVRKWEARLRRRSDRSSSVIRYHSPSKDVREPSKTSISFLNFDRLFAISILQISLACDAICIAFVVGFRQIVQHADHTAYRPSYSLASPNITNVFWGRRQHLFKDFDTVCHKLKLSLCDFENENAFDERRLPIHRIHLTQHRYGVSGTFVSSTDTLMPKAAPKISLPISDKP